MLWKVRMSYSFTVLNNKKTTMKNYKNIFPAALILIIVNAGLLISCTKYGNGFLSPSVSYAVNQFTITKGRVTTSYSLTTDGSSVPMHVKWKHIYDSNGNIVDTLFTKKYLIPVWTAIYNPLADINYALISSKRSFELLQPLVVNESNGTIEANSGTIYLPSGIYSMDLDVSNAAGSQVLKNSIKIILVEGKPVEAAPETGTLRNQIFIAGSATSKRDLFNGANNPFDFYTITRFADTPNIFILKITDKNGVPFNPKSGEIIKRPSSGLNPTPPFLQNLQDYAPDTFTTTDSSINLKYPLVPFPIASLGNGFNIYYLISTQYVHIDSTSAWSSNTPDNFYKGVLDSHFKGVYTDNKYDFGIRIPLRIQVPGAYYMTIKILNTTHK